MFSSPLVRHFLLDGRVQERKGLHAFFYGAILGTAPDSPRCGQMGSDLLLASGLFSAMWHEVRRHLLRNGGCPRNGVRPPTCASAHKVSTMRAPISLLLF